MHTPPVPHDDRTLDFWEHGPIRIILEMEFEMALQQMQREGTRLTEERERALHDEVIPAVFALLTDHIGWTADEERTRAFLPATQHRLQREMDRLVRLSVPAQDALHADADYTLAFQPLLLPSRSFSARVRRFLWSS